MLAAPAAPALPRSTCRPPPLAHALSRALCSPWLVRSHCHAFAVLPVCDQVNLCRLHTKLSNFADAVSAVETIPIEHPELRGFVFLVPKALVTLCYCGGFSLLMLQRYARAIDVLSVPLRGENRSHMSYVGRCMLGVCHRVGYPSSRCVRCPCLPAKVIPASLSSSEYGNRG